MIDPRSFTDARGLPARSPTPIAPRLRRAAPRSLGVDADTFVAMTLSPETSEEAMRNLHVGSDDSRVDDPLVSTQERNREGLPNRLLSAFEVASFIGCHEETVRRAYWRGLLRSQRFGVRGRRFHPGDVLDWLSRGAPTKSS